MDYKDFTIEQLRQEVKMLQDEMFYNPSGLCGVGLQWLGDQMEDVLDEIARRGSMEDE